MGFIRAAFAVVAALPPLLVFACGSPETKPPVLSGRPTPSIVVPDAAAEVPQAPPQYVIAEPGGSVRAVTPLPSESATGVMLDGLRIVVRGPLMRAAKEVAEAPLIAAYTVPQRFGGGFLFRTRNAIYASDTWDGALKPIVSTPSDIVDVSFGPKWALVRGDGGERWAIALPSGAREPIAPVGLLEIGALDDGRAVAVVELGKLLVSSDAGASWKDATSQLRGRPDKIIVKDGALYVALANSGAVRVEAGGQLAVFDRAPDTKPKPKEKDPRWRTEEPPIRRAIRLGAPVDDQTAVVVVDGDVIRVNVFTGEIVGVTQGKLPPDGNCEAVKTSDDVVFVCTRPNNVAFVVSHALGDKQPVIEQTFTAQGQFYVGDDGGIAFGGPCTRAKASKQIVCVRGAQGNWQEYDLEGTNGDGGAPLDVSRWIPRADGGAIGIVVGATWGVIDARSGELRTWTPDQLSAPLRSALTPSAYGRYPYYYGARADSRVSDRTWSITPAGTLRGWGVGANNGAFEISLDGTVTASPFSFDRVQSAGPFALSRTRDGRIWQSLDRGVTWSEVAAPPAAKPSSSVDVRSCSAVGCDLGAWYRIGWAAIAPSPPIAVTTAASPSEVKREPLPQLSCRPTGDAKKNAIGATESSPADYGLGANRVAVNDDKGDREYLRVAFGRAVPNPLRGSGDANETGAVRAIVHGPATRFDDDNKLVIVGPSKDIMALRRQLFFVAPFDPGGALYKNALTAGDIVAAARAIGAQSPSDYVRQDPAQMVGVVPLMSADPVSADDLLFVTDSGIIDAVRGTRSKVSIITRRLDDGHYVGAASLGADEMALLEVDGAGRERIVRVGPSGAMPVFELPPVPSAASFAANLDTVAVGPKAELGILRTPSAAEPSSAFDPAIVLASSGAVVQLAPWATLTSADDPACKSDPSGWRATMQTNAPWVKLAGIDTSANDEVGIMLARVRWNAARVCLEAIELRADDMNVAARGNAMGPMMGRFVPGSPGDGPVENWVVARFATTASAGRVGVVPGAEVRQAMACTLGQP
jgi:hypothetical protein